MIVIVNFVNGCTNTYYDVCKISEAFDHTHIMISFSDGRADSISKKHIVTLEIMC